MSAQLETHTAENNLPDATALALRLVDCCWAAEQGLRRLLETLDEGADKQ